MINIQEKQVIFLAALLHDIGKFNQRAEKGIAENFNELSESSKNMAKDISSLNEQVKFGYQHVIWTNEFFELIKPTIEKIPELKDNLFESSNEDNLINLACNHHQPQSILQSIVTISDWWSAGIDRSSTFEKEELQLFNWGNINYKTIPLFSIFNSVNNGKYNFGFPLTALGIQKEIFPKEIKTSEDGITQFDYKKLWNLFIKEFEHLPTNNIKVFTESLIYLLRKYTWCIPSNTMDMKNVSLYDHLKTTAAFADCLFTYYAENKNNFNWNDSDKRLLLKKDIFPVLILGGDISGIQKFIYNISSRKAATSLKGRSLYVQLMIDSIIHRIISHKSIQATNGHVVYSSGGKFFMLLPNTESVKKAIIELELEFEKEIWIGQKGKLIFSLDFVPFAYGTKEKEIDFNGRDCDENNLGSLWKKLAEKLTSKKNQKLKSILLGHYNDFFEVQDTGGQVEVCAVTGIELKKGEFHKIKDSEVIVSNSVYKQIELGEKLKEVDYLVTYLGDEENLNLLSKKDRQSINIINVVNFLFAQNELTTELKNFQIKSGNLSQIKRFNNTDFLSSPLKGLEVSYGFQLYGGYKQAIYDNHRDKTFEELTRVKAEEKNSETYLGVLRMDVDGLGEIFINGISNNDKSFASYATLSSHLDWFFSGYINSIREKYADNVNILYSGGDDVFAVGRWDLIIAFADDIRNSFKQFVGREDISISAGITIIGNKFPIAKAAVLSGDAEHAAKMFESAELGNKNAINLFGKTISWKKEFNEVKYKKNEFVSLINDFGMSKGILHRIMLFGEIQSNNQRNKNKVGFVPDLSYHWNAAYYLKRYMENKDKSVQEFCKELQIDLFVPRKMELIVLAARWAELELRMVSK